MKKIITGNILAAMQPALPACTQNGETEPTTSSTPLASSTPSASIETPQDTPQTAPEVTLENLTIGESARLTANFADALPALAVKYKPFDAVKVLAALMPGVSIEGMTSTPCEFIVIARQAKIKGGCPVGLL